MYNFNNSYPGMNYGYAAKPKLPEPTNPLTKEEMATLKQKAPQFSLAVDQITALKAICTHRDQNGDTLLQNPDGTVTCTICGTTFRPVNTASIDDVAQIFQSAIDCLETIKIMYFDIPNDVTKGFFQMTPFLEKAPQLFKVALDHYNRYGNTTVNGRDYNNGNAFALFSAMMQPGMAMGMGMPQQTMPYGQPGMVQQPMNAPVPDVTMGAANGMNPFDAGSPAMNAAKTTTDNKQYSL